VLILYFVISEPLTEVFIVDVPLKTGPLARRNEKGLLITRTKDVLIHKDLVSNIFSKSVHLVYQKIRKQNSALVSPCKRAGFKSNILYY
jgi:lysyl-tRNA synthetase class II